MSEPMPSDAIVPPPPEAAGPDATASGDGAPPTPARKKRRRGSRGGRNRPRPASDPNARVESDDDAEPELPDRPFEGQIHDPAVAERVLVPRKPQIGDSMPAPTRAEPTTPDTP